MYSTTTKHICSLKAIENQIGMEIRYGRFRLQTTVFQLLMDSKMFYILKTCIYKSSFENHTVASYFFRNDCPACAWLPHGKNSSRLT
jgi:hypothetical protein